MLLQILGKAHFKQVEGANTFGFPRQEPIQALILSLVAVSPLSFSLISASPHDSILPQLHHSFELWSEGVFGIHSVMTDPDHWDWNVLSREHAKVFEDRQAAYARLKGIPPSKKWEKIINGARKFM